tara:strand:- start:276 stop:851 length:576 start_codon:yes stop_codon:yes gene_type:complete
MDFDYFNFKSNNKVTKGSLILSQPLMKDLNFERSIILICEHNSDGSFGYKLNDKLSPDSVTSDLNQIIKENLYIGGPVENSYLNFIHNSDQIKDSVKITDNIYLGGELDSVLEGVENNISDFKLKFFSGYSGWSPKQLDKEIEENSWIVINEYISNFIFDEIDEKFWTSFLSDKGGKHKIFSNYPKDPSLN